MYGYLNNSNVVSLKLCAFKTLNVKTFAQRTDVGEGPNTNDQRAWKTLGYCRSISQCTPDTDFCTYHCHATSKLYLYK